MFHNQYICGAIVSACLLFSSALFAASNVVPSTADDAAAVTRMQEARDYEEAGNYNRAASIYRDIVKRYAVTPSASAAQFRLAELLDHAGNSNKAFEAYQSLVENYPQSREFDQALAAQLAIADDFMDRKRYDRAVEMYTAILAAAPFAKFAPAAQFKLGQAYENQREFQQAIQNYQVILERYPTSNYAADALYQIGFVQLSEAQARNKDLSAAIDAKHTFEEFLMEYPDSEKAAQAKENLARMGGREATDIMSIARFYDRNSNFRAAVIYYAELVRRQPGTEDARIASERIEEIRATVGDDELRSSPEREETGERAAMRRRLQNQIETSALSNFAGPPADKVKPAEETAPPTPRLRTSPQDVQPMGLDSADLPPIEPDLPSE